MYGGTRQRETAASAWQRLGPEDCFGKTGENEGERSVTLGWGLLISQSKRGSRKGKTCSKRVFRENASGGI